MKWWNGILAITGTASAVMGQISVPSPGGSQFMTVLGSLLLIAVCISLYYQIMANRRKAMEPPDPERRIIPSPLEVKSVEELARKTELERLEVEIKDMFKEQNAQSEARIQKVHERINAIAEEMPGKVIKLLKDTGHLRWPGERK